MEHGSLSRVLASGKPDCARVKDLLKAVKVKVQSGGSRNKRGELTRGTHRKSVLRFVNGLNPISDDDREIVEAIIDHDGSQVDAARYLGVHKNKISTFLQMKGYYRK